MKTLNNLPTHAHSRRNFIKTTSGFMLTAGVMGWELPSRAANQTKPWPIACRDTHLRSTGKPDCWSALNALGCSGVEVAVNANLDCTQLFHPGKKYRIGNDDDMRMLQDDLSANNLVITSLLMNNRLTEQLEQELVWARKLVAAAQKMKVNAIRIDVTPGSMSKEQFLPYAIKACKQLCEIAEGTPVRYGIENHGHVTNDPDFLEKLFAGVGSMHLGLTLDTANFYWYGHPLETIYGLCEKFATRAWHTHCKSIRFPADKKNVRRAIGWEYEKYAAPVYEGDIDYAKVVKILRQANYRGDLCLENECLGHYPREQHLDVLKKEIAWLRQL